MIKKTIYIQKPCHLSIHDKQLQITDKKTRQTTHRAVDDIGFIVLDHAQTTFTQSVIQEFTENNTAVIFCDATHHPASMTLNLDGHQTQSEHFRAQIDATLPLKKSLWQQTVKAKLKNQASVLEQAGGDGEALRYQARQVKSGDPENVEGRGSRYYWPNLFGMEFKRDRFGLPPNNLLNYGYAVLRAAVARALTGSGLLPTLGIHHHNKYNAFCLADDIMEPYRPYVDLTVLELIQTGCNAEDISPAIKQLLLQVLVCDVVIGRKTRPLMIGLTETTASLTRCFKGEAQKIKYPVL